MAGIVDANSTCSTRNALRNITDFACGVTFSYRSWALESPPDMQYGVVSLQQCCDQVGARVQRIPGNTACEMQFCEVPGETMLDGSIGPPRKVETCMTFVDETDLPEDIAQDITGASHWCVVRNYDDTLAASDDTVAVTAAEAPPSWTSAALHPLNVPTVRPASSTAGAAPTPTNGGSGRYDSQRASDSLRIWTIAVLMFVGLVAAL
ncbi:hypothetical protein GGS23DRAFT_342179 [Durotheca rogersii]|uniref:uncharacterized protein n=1 Tax=Durotheca rogersii TaxID=419775 RepID=UPI00221EBB73|nr:uncharacterized protein GGS23DRAFT_342179 [Durotheca rogersii]KAI5857443.1 hypothetical protein GGS23DRAFT_342179 [Durotheca rogersii]